MVALFTVSIGYTDSTKKATYEKWKKITSQPDNVSDLKKIQKKSWQMSNFCFPGHCGGVIQLFNPL
jgi:hypothetical protein